MAAHGGFPKPSMILRWTALIVVEASLGFIAVYSARSTSATIAEVLAEYGDALVPAGFAKTAVVLILGAFLIFFLAALRPRRHRVRIYDRLVIPLALTGLLAASWVVVFRHEAIAVSFALLAAITVLAGGMFLQVATVSPGNHSRWLRVPFSLHFGAMTIALLVATSQWVSGSGLLTGTAMEPPDVARAFLAIAAAFGGLVALRYRDFVYPAVITFGLGSMYLAQRGYDPDVATSTLIACVGMFVVASLAAIALARPPWRKPAPGTSQGRASHPRTVKDDGWLALDANSSIMRL